MHFTFKKTELKAINTQPINYQEQALVIFNFLPLLHETMNLTGPHTITWALLTPILLPYPF